MLQVLMAGLFECLKQQGKIVSRGLAGFYKNKYVLAFPVQFSFSFGRICPLAVVRFRFR